MTGTYRYMSKKTFRLGVQHQNVNHNVLRYNGFKLSIVTESQGRRCASVAAARLLIGAGTNWWKRAWDDSSQRMPRYRSLPAFAQVVRVACCRWLIRNARVVLPVCSQDAPQNAYRARCRSTEHVVAVNVNSVTGEQLKTRDVGRMRLR